MMNSSKAAAQYICPTCFRCRSSNDVFFLRNAYTVEIDRVKTKYWRRIGQRSDPYPVTRFLADWRAYPESRRSICDGVVESLVDYDGSLLKQRICPSCHFPLRPLEENTLFPLFWRNGGVDVALGVRVLSSLRGWKQVRQPASLGSLPLCYQYAIRQDGLCAALPTDLLSDGQPCDSSIFDRYCFSTGVVLVSLCVSAGNGSEDNRATDALSSVSKAYGMWTESVTRPTAILIENDDAFKSDGSLTVSFSESHETLLKTARLIFSESRIFPAEAEGMRSAMEWLADTWLEHKNSESVK